MPISVSEGFGRACNENKLTKMNPMSFPKTVEQSFCTMQVYVKTYKLPLIIGIRLICYFYSLDTVQTLADLSNYVTRAFGKRWLLA